MSADPAVAYCAELRLKLMGILCTGKLQCGRFGFFTLAAVLMGITGVSWGKTATHIKKKSLATFEGLHSIIVTALKKMNLCGKRDNAVFCLLLCSDQMRAEENFLLLRN